MSKNTQLTLVVLNFGIFLILFTWQSLAFRIYICICILIRCKGWNFLIILCRDKRIAHLNEKQPRIFQRKFASAISLLIGSVARSINENATFKALRPFWWLKRSHSNQKDNTSMTAGCIIINQRWNFTGCYSTENHGKVPSISKAVHHRQWEACKSQDDRKAYN